MQTATAPPLVFLFVCRYTHLPRYGMNPGTHRLYAANRKSIKFMTFAVTVVKKRFSRLCNKTAGLGEAAGRQRSIVVWKIYTSATIEYACAVYTSTIIILHHLPDRIFRISVPSSILLIESDLLLPGISLERDFYESKM